MRLLPHSASTIAPQVDWLTLALLALSGFIIVLIAGLIIFFVIHYRQSRHPVAEQPKNTLTAEISWTIVPLVLSLGLFVWAGVVYFKMHSPPPGASEVYVVAKQWMWKFQHPDGRQELNELHVPAGTPIRLIMISQDVIHSFFVPAFRVKQDVLPGRYTETWFQATKPGEYHLFCSQYCGTNHASMKGRIIVMDPAQFSVWKASGIGQQSSLGNSLASRGRELFTRLGCISCHAQGQLPPSMLKGKPPGRKLPAVKAPDLAGIYGTEVGLRTGEKVFADENYLRESILRPNAKIVQGFDAIMPSFEGQISEEDVAALIAYIKTLKNAETIKRGAPSKEGAR